MNAILRSIPGIRKILAALFPPSPSSKRYLKRTIQRQDGSLIKVDTRNLILWEEYFWGGYEPQITRVIRKVLKPGDCALDVGANLGVHTLTMARIVEELGIVVAIEPNPQVFDELSQNLRINGLNQVTAICAAAGSEKGKAKLRIPTAESAEASNPGLASIHALETPHNEVEISVLKIDDLKLWEKKQRLALIKIDVQGYEEKVIVGMLETLDKTGADLIFEYEDWAWNKSGASWQNVIELLLGRKYIIKVIKQDQLTELTEQDRTRPAAHLEIIATKRPETNLK